MKPQNNLGQKSPLRPLSAAINPALPSPPLSHVPKDCIHNFLNASRDGDTTPWALLGVSMMIKCQNHCLKIRRMIKICFIKLLLGFSFSLSMRKNFSVQGSQHCNRLPRELRQVAQRGCGVPLAGGTQVQPGHNPVPCALAPCLSREVRPAEPLWSLPTLPFLGFCIF